MKTVEIMLVYLVIFGKNVLFYIDPNICMVVNSN